jgi:hypothetical protein
MQKGRGRNSPAFFYVFEFDVLASRLMAPYRRKSWVQTGIHAETGEGRLGKEFPGPFFSFPSFPGVAVESSVWLEGD